MDLFILELIAAAILFYYIGQRFGQNVTQNPEETQYIQLQVSEAPEKKLNQLSAKQQEKIDADIQKSLNDLNEYKNRESKMVGEIRELRQILEENSKGSENQRYQQNRIQSNIAQNVGLISDKDFESLLDEAGQGVLEGKEFSEDDFDRELSEAAK